MRQITFVAALAATSMLFVSACKQEPTTTAANAPATPAASGGIDGTWKADLASVQIDGKPDQYLLKDGKFDCPSCTPPYTIAADGAFHDLKRPYSDSTSVKIDNDHTVTLTSKKAGVVVGTSKFTVSADGKSLTSEFTDSSVPGAKPVTGTSTRTRTADGPAGAHLMSGSWKLAKYDSMSDEGLTVTFKTDGDSVTMSSPGGVGYTAKTGGPAVSITGDTAGTTAALTKDGDSYVETDSRDGNVVSVTRFGVGANGKLHTVTENKLNGSSVTYDATRM